MANQAKPSLGAVHKASGNFLALHLSEVLRHGKRILMLRTACSLALILAVAAAGPVFSQQEAPPPPNTEFRITSIDVSLVDSPNFNVSGYDKRVRRPGKWLEIEVAFDWQPRLPEPKYLDDLTVTYFVWLNNKSREFPNGALLTGSVTHMSVSQGKGMRSVMYIAPKTLERFFDGKLPVNASQALQGVGAEISVGGNVVAGFTPSGRGPERERPWAWWDAEMFKDKISGALLNKSETPFAVLAYDYHEVVKPRTP